MADKKYDFSGWATKNDLVCSDNRVIRRDAFKHNDGLTVPLVWQHQHDGPSNVLGHCLLENREEGVYTYGSFNDTAEGQKAKQLVQHGDITHMSIFANRLEQRRNSSGGRDVMHGEIREVSLVLAGANPGALIDCPILAHSGEECEEEGIIYTDNQIELYHADSESSKSENNNSEKGEKEMAEGSSEKTIKQVFDSMTEEQKNVCYFMIGEALKGQSQGDSAAQSDEFEGEDTMKHNVFDGDYQEETCLSHDEINEIFKDAKRLGSLHEAVLQHDAEDAIPPYGIENIDYLFPEARNVTAMPEMVKRPDSWVAKFYGRAKHTPFSRIKSMHADITEDDARALGYMKGKKKKEEVFSLLKRTTEPTTVYKKAKLDRDDIVDITDFDVVAFQKSEMRGLLDEEIARAGLLGDGRSPASEDHIPEDHIRPVYTDDDFFAMHVVITVAANATDDDIAKELIRAQIKARKDFRGTGSPVFFTTDDVLTNCLLLTDNEGRDLYDSESKLATKMRVSEIVPVVLMENKTRTVDGVSRELLGITMNPNDYTYGADRGGAVNMFDDFDIDYNQQKFLMEARCSGALTKYHSAIVFELVRQSA